MLVPTEPATLDPRFATDAVAMRATRLLHAGLFGLDPDTLEPTPLLAASHRFDGPTRLSITLREGVRFASGAPLEADDVCSTLHAFASPALASPHRSIAEVVARCTPDGPTALTLDLAAPRATILTDLELPILRRDQASLPPSQARELDGLGPYRLGRAGHDAVELLPRDHGALARPSRAVTLRVVHDENARVIRLLAGRADVVPNGVSPTLLPALEQSGAALAVRPGANLTYLLVHNQRPGLDTAASRRALAAAIDRASIAAHLHAGKARVAGTFVPPESWAYEPPRAPLAFDPEAARPALAHLAGRKLSLLTSTDRLRVTVARAMGQMLERAGLDVEVVPLELGVLLHRLTAGDFELAVLQIPEMTEPNLLRWFFHSSSIPSPRERRAGANRARYQSAEVDALLDEASSIVDRGARKALYARALSKMNDDMPVVPLFHEDQVAALSPAAASFKPSAEGRWLGLAAVP